MQHTVPNSLPKILWQKGKRRGSRFDPMFENRRMSAEQASTLQDYHLPIDAADIARGLRQHRLAEALERQPDATTRYLLLVLALANRGRRGPDAIAQHLMVPHRVADSLAGACAKLGLIDGAGRLTDSGRSELAAARRRALVDPPRIDLVGEAGPYYPKRLRGVGSV